MIPRFREKICAEQQQVSSHTFQTFEVKVNVAAVSRENCVAGIKIKIKSLIFNTPTIVCRSPMTAKGNENFTKLQNMQIQQFKLLHV